MEINFVLVALIFWAAGCLTVAWVLDKRHEHRVASHAVPVLRYTQRAHRVSPRRW